MKPQTTTAPDCEVEIRRAEESDFDGIWEIIHQVVERGDTYPYHPDTTKEQAWEIWMSKAITTYVAVLEGEIVGTYILRPNQPGLGSHVANAGYMVRDGQHGRGIATAMCEHSLAEARRAGYLAMQFNAVVSTNERAKRLWELMGFSVVGRVPQGFRHREQGLVDILIMHRFL
jgi:L-amino acid N-acyltransferase YncA